jgi:hypothetical protein
VFTFGEVSLKNVYLNETNSSSVSSFQLHTISTLYSKVGILKDLVMSIGWCPRTKVEIE